MNKKNISVSGFLTIITVFLIISLVTIGGLSLSATGSGDRLTERTGEYLILYRNAYNESEKRLADVDGCIAEAAYSGVFDMNFEGLISELDFAELSFDGKNYMVECTTPIDGKTAVYWKIAVDAFPADRRGGYTLLERRTVSISGADESDGEHLNVWLG